jgi:DNA invertase Pin-like site-specific DNA recombinase
MATGNFIAYYRVSTDKQGKSGLGLEAQKSAVLDYLNGGRWKLVGEFTEVESGKRNDRPQLATALAACRLRRATLVVAKLDRLTRNVHFVSTLMESKVDFTAVDFPQANKLTIHILAAVAEHEAEAISARTKAALAAAKARGVKLGRPGGGIVTDAMCAASATARKGISARFSADVAPAILTARDSGASSLREIATWLNSNDIPTARGGKWQATQVQRVLARLAA